MTEDNLILITDRHKEPVNHLRSLYSGRAGFLVCGGPSFNADCAAQISQRGVWSLAVNNVAGMVGYRPSAFVCSDPPSKFHHGIWLDPTVMKFVPLVKFSGRRNKLREKKDGQFFPLVRDGMPVTTKEAPNTFGFERRSWLLPDDTFFTDKAAAWGNNKAGSSRTKEPRTVCTMLLAIRLMYHLGFRRVYLLGVDFWMDQNAGPKDNYSFGELRDKNAIISNNDQFRVVNGWLCTMVDKGVFDRFGMEIFNCNPNSGLRAFMHVPFEDALEDVLDGFPKEPFDLQDWYKK